MGLLDLFVAASIPVLKVLLVTALGSFIALDHINILGDDARKHVNNTTFTANLFSARPEALTELKPEGNAISQIFGNLGNMLLIIIPAVCKEKGSPFGAPDVCHTYGMAYASLSMAIIITTEAGGSAYITPGKLSLSAEVQIGAIYLWSYVYNIVRISSRASSIEVEIISSPHDSKSSSESSISQPESCTEPLLSSKDSVGLVDKYALPCTTLDGKAQLSIAEKFKRLFETVLRKINVKRLFAPSTTGAASYVQFVLASSCLTTTIMHANWPYYGSFVSFIFLTATLCVLICTTMPVPFLYDCRDGAIPALTLIVGGNLLKGLRGSGIKKSIIVGIIVARYVALPLIGIVIVRGALKFGLVHSDPLYQFVLLLQFALPPAMNIGTITQLFGAGESECSVIMLWTYALASISLTLWSTFFMWLVA
ncbi:hypothetical protein RJ640_020658 [Escallonia rubra]|uniref:Auxin efflux carrier n=1 Tax=Escallonia rubra TaxID=112253 RepID=A0AA88RS36_9ASTE|nr:hypothetical protein RJ640_020658 [Escallonia rubra]